jgi:hypothetical protein
MSDWPEIEAANAIIDICAEAGDSIGMISWNGHIKPILDEFYVFKAEDGSLVATFMAVLARNLSSQLFENNKRALAFNLAAHISIVMGILKAERREAVEVPFF